MTALNSKLREAWRHPHRWWRLRNLTVDVIICALRGHTWVTCEVADFCSQCMREPGEIRDLHDYFAAEARWGRK